MTAHEKRREEDERKRGEATIAGDTKLEGRGKGRWFCGVGELQRCGKETGR